MPNLGDFLISDSGDNFADKKKLNHSKPHKSKSFDNSLPDFKISPQITKLEKSKKRALKPVQTEIDSHSKPTTQDQAEKKIITSVESQKVIHKDIDKVGLVHDLKVALQEINAEIPKAVKKLRPKINSDDTESVLSALKRVLPKVKADPSISRHKRGQSAIKTVPEATLLDNLEESILEVKIEPKIEKFDSTKRVKKIKEYDIFEEESAEAESNIVDFLEKTLPTSEFAPEVVEVGEVIYIGDGICKITGLANARIDDVLEVKTEKGIVLVLVLGISNDLVESVVLGDYFAVKRGNVVVSTQKTLKIPTGKNVLGRIISPIGRPLDGKGPLEDVELMDVERPAPAVYMRTPIIDQLKTGFLVIDSIIPVGLGQRELVTGDRKSGKTRLMMDVLCNLSKQNIFCIYVGIGGQKAKIKAISEYLEHYGALKNTAIVMGSSDDPPSLNYLAPYAGTAIAEHFCDKGQDALIVYDDLSKHAKAYRQMSLLLKRSPGRDAYPGDIFYLHSRLLERTAKVLPKYGGGSITALPMCETQNGDISEYITTNLMSITDGHIYLDAQMMHDGILPAVNSSSSVSRIGGSIQPKLLRNLGAIAGTQLARFNEVKSYETMNTEITEETEREINRGKRLLEFFNQASGLNFIPAEETILLYTVTGGLTDFIPLEIVAKLKLELVDFYQKNAKDFPVLTDVTARKDIDDKDYSMLDDFLKKYIEKVDSECSKALKVAWDKKYSEIEAKEKEKAAAADSAAPEGEKDKEVKEKASAETAVESKEKEAEVVSKNEEDSDKDEPKETETKDNKKDK
ncbi:MAG: F0F1 ATP synthase subunit alpha [bacterium]